MTRKRNPRHCIKCESLTSTPNQICRNCCTIEWEKIPLEFWHQFMGLFMGEGSISIGLNNRFRNAPYLRFCLVQREDDRKVMRAIQKYLGGSISVDNHGKNPQLRWTLQKNKDIQEVCQRIMESCVLQSKKLFDVQLAVEYFDWYFSRQFHNGDYSYAYQLREKLMASHLYHSLDFQGTD